MSLKFYDFSEVPNDWQLTRLKYILDFSDEISANYKSDKNLSLTKSGIIEKNIFSNEGQIAKNYEKYISVRKGNICMNPMDLLSGWVDISIFEGLISPAYYTLIPKEKFEGKFLNYFLQSNYYRETFFTLGKGVASHDNYGRWVLTPEEFKNIYIYYPKLDKQKLISDYLDKKIKQIDSLVRNIQKKIELLKEKKTSLINELVTKGLDPNFEMKDSGIEWTGEVPRHWEIIQVKRLFSDCFGGSWGEDPLEDQTEGLVKVIRVTEFETEHLSVSMDIPTLRSLRLKDGSKKFIQKGDLILEKSGGGEKTPVGRVVIFNRDSDFPTVNSNFTNVCRPNLRKVDPKFCVYLLSSLYSSGVTVRNIKQTTGIQNLDLSAFMSELVPLPPLKEQFEISTNLEKSTSKILEILKIYRNKVNLLIEYKQSLVSSAVTGKFKILEAII